MALSYPVVALTLFETRIVSLAACPPLPRLSCSFWKGPCRHSTVLNCLAWKLNAPSRISRRRAQARTV